MPMLKAPRQISRRQELRQDVVATGFARVVQWYEDFRNYLIGAAIVLLVLLFAGIAYAFYQQTQNRKASELLGGIVRLYEQGQYRQALDGTAENPGLIEIADSYDGTRDGNLAAFYAGDALFRLGEFDDALGYFQAFDNSESYVGASAFAGEAAIYEARGEYERAAERYQDAAGAFPSQLTSPDYLLGAARNYEAAGDYESAREAYQQILDEYEGSQAAASVDLLMARLETIAQ